MFKVSTDKEARGVLPNGRHLADENLWLVVRGESRSWVVRSDGRDFSIGSIKKVSLARARSEAAAILAQLRDGTDPTEEKRKAKQAEERRKTFAQAAEGVMAAHNDSWRVSELTGKSSTAVQWATDMSVVCKPIADKFVDEITVEDIKALAAPFFANGHRDRALGLIGRIEKVFNSAIWQGWRTAANPASVKMFAEHHPKAKGEDAHHAAIDWREAPALMQKLAKSSAVGGRLVEFIMLTAVGSQEGRGALWSEIDFDKRVWTIPGSRMKKAKAHEAPLSDQAIELLRGMPRVGEFVFPGGRGEIAQAADKSMSNQSVWNFVKRAVGHETDATTHGFRSTFKDWANNQGIDRDLSERCLAHDIGDRTETAYARETLTELRRPVMAAWGAYLGGDSPSDNVVPLRRIA